MTRSPRTRPGPPLFGAHMSVAGGLPRAVERAVAHGCDAFQIFTRNPNQWSGRPLPADEIAAFRDARSMAGIGPVVSHASYLINLATNDTTLRRRSLDAMTDEIDRAEALGLLGVVVHPGCHGSLSETDGLALIGEAVSRLLRDRPDGRTLILLESTAGQGSSLGKTFEELAAIVAHTGHDARVGICLDTCHLLAAGYDIRSAKGYVAAFEEFESRVGLERLRLFHVNDSKKPLGSRVDRHEHLGRGHLGLAPFRRLVNDRRFAGLPMVLETPKATRTAGRVSVSVDPEDRRNLELLRRMAHSPVGRSTHARRPASALRRRQG